VIIFHRDYNFFCKPQKISSFFEAILFPLEPHVSLGAAQIDDLGAAVPLQNKTKESGNNTENRYVSRYFSK
jgi:hypothetical protein